MTSLSVGPTLHRMRGLLQSCLEPLQQESSRYKLGVTSRNVLDWPSLAPFFCSPLLLPEIKLTRGSWTQGHSSMGAAQKLPKRARVAAWTLKSPPLHQLCTLGPAASLGEETMTEGGGGRKSFPQSHPTREEQKGSLVRIPAGRGLRAAREMEFITGPL